MTPSEGVTISAFGDEIADDLNEQLTVLQGLRIGWLDLRGAWGKNVLHLDDDEVAEVKKTLALHNMDVSCIGSPVGKSPITEPIETEASNLTASSVSAKHWECNACASFRFIRQIFQQTPTMTNMSKQQALVWRN